MATVRKFTTPDISTLSDGEVLRIGSISETNCEAIYPGTGFVSEDSTWTFAGSVDGEFWEDLAGSNFTGENGTNGIAKFTCNSLFIGIRLNLANTETAGVLDITLTAK